MMKNKLPEGGEWKKLGELANLVMGQSPPSDTYNDKSEGLPFFQGKAEFGIRFPEVRKYCSKPVRIAEKDDILMSVRAPVGSLNIANQKCCIGRGLCAIRISNKVDTLFLYHFLKSIEKEISAKGEGSTFTAINRKDIERIEIPLPPLPVQKRIVAILERAESLKQKREEANDDTNTIIQSLFYEMFGDQHLNEKHLKIKTIENSCKVQSGGTPSRKVKEYWDNGIIPWVGSTVCKNSLVLSSEQFITEEGLKNSAAKWFEADTVLVALVGATIGKTGLLKIRATTNQNIAGISPLDADELNSIYLFYALQQLYPQFLALSNDSFKMANLSFIKSLEIVIPPVSLQNRFASLVEKIESLKQKQSESTSDINILFDALMQKAFDGGLA